MSFNNILVFRIGHLGDTLVALPAFWELRRAFPNAKLTLLSNVDAANPNYLSPRSVLPAQGLFDEYVDYPTNLGPFASKTAALKLLFRLRTSRYDGAFYLMPRTRALSAIARDKKFFRLAGISELRGARYLEENRLPDVPPKPTPRVETESEFLLHALASEGVPLSAQPQADLLLSAEERGLAEDWLDKNGMNGAEHPLLAIAPGSKWESKLWFEDRFFETVRRVIEATGALPLIFGGPEDREKGDRLIASWGRGGNASGDLSVRGSAALLERCSAYLGNDSGPMHLAAAVGLPCVGIFAAVDYIGRWEPFGTNNTTFRERVECEGCHSPVCFNAHKCLDLVDVDRVTAACLAALNR